MSALAAVLFTAVILGYFWHRDRARLDRAHDRIQEISEERNEALDVARSALRLHGEALELFADEQHAHEQTRDDLRWSRITAATLIAPDMRPTILAAHRDLAPVVPIGGRG